jgi:hypothetical protein
VVLRLDVDRLLARVGVDCLSPRYEYELAAEGVRIAGLGDAEGVVLFATGVLEGLRMGDEGGSGIEAAEFAM